MSVCVFLYMAGMPRISWPFRVAMVDGIFDARDMNKSLTKLNDTYSLSLNHP